MTEKFDIKIIARCPRCGRSYEKQAVIGEGHKDCKGDIWLAELLAAA